MPERRDESQQEKMSDDHIDAFTVYFWEMVLAEVEQIMVILMFVWTIPFSYEKHGLFNNSFIIAIRFIRAFQQMCISRWDVNDAYENYHVYYCSFPEI